MRLGPDQWILWQSGFVKLDATIAFTWALMAAGLLTVGAVARRRSAV